MRRIVHWEVLSDDPQKTLDFYEKAFGWKSEQWGEIPYWLVMTGPEGTPGIDGGVAGPMDEFDQRVVNTIDTDDIDASIAAVEAAGGTVVVPKSAMPMVGWLVYCADPTGIVFGLMQSDESVR